MNDSLADGLQRVLATQCSFEHVRELEAGGAATLWQAVEPLGYGDAFVAEEQGGIGLPLSAAFELGFALGQGAFPLPLLETAVARSLLAGAGHDIPAGPLVLCDARPDTERRVALPQTPGLRHAGHALVRHDEHWHLLPLAGLVVGAGAYRPAITCGVDSVSLQGATVRFAAPHAAATLTAPLQAAEMAGSMTAVLDMTLAYATERRQFGRPIGQFQALQMEIASMAELVAFATMAARLGCAGTVDAPDELRALNAKLACSDAAERVVAIAHAVHGAIGITEEYALGIHARRLHEWRATGPSAGACAGRLGRALVRQPVDTLQFVREHLSLSA